MGIITIDGSCSSGSQVLRDALSLSLATGKAFKLTNFRPFGNNHLAYIKVATTIGNAEVDGAVLGSTNLVFTPTTIQSGLLTMATPPSNNIGLAIQTVLPALVRNKASTILQFKGGTDFPNSPSIDFISKSYLPLINKMGSNCSVRCPLRGFYPAGGGRVQLEIHPAKEYKPLNLLERGALLSKQATVINANLPGNIAERELALIRLHLGWSSKETKILFDNSPEPGNVLNLELNFQNITILYTSVGQRGIHAESVAENGAQAVSGYLSSSAPVDEHLAHQLIIPMLAMGGGQFVTNTLSEHSKSLLALSRQFIPGNITVKPQGLQTLVSINHL